MGSSESRRRRARAAVVAAAAALILPSPADAVIRLNQGMAGVRIGMTPAEVRERLGAPSSRTRHGRITNLIYRRPGVVVSFLARRVVVLSTAGRRERTRRGVGVGSTERAVRRLVPGARCESAEGVRTCSVGGLDVGDRNTVFVLRGGRVRSVTVARVFD